jgi:hypothetical protein
MAGGMQMLKKGGKNAAKFGANRVAKKQVDAVAQQLKMTGAQRKKFGKFIETTKGREGRGGADNFDYDELIELGKEFLGR